MKYFVRNVVDFMIFGMLVAHSIGHYFYGGERAIGFVCAITAMLVLRCSSLDDKIGSR